MKNKTNYAMTLGELLQFFTIETINAFTPVGSLAKHMPQLLTIVESKFDAMIPIEMKSGVMLEFDNVYFSRRFFHTYLTCDFSKNYTKIAPRFNSLSEEDKSLFLNELSFWLVEYYTKTRGAYERYKLLINKFNDNIDNILIPYIDTITEVDATKGITRFNKTPTNRGNYTAQEFTTNITEVENLPSTATSRTKQNILEQLVAIKSNWENLYEKWLNEYTLLFYV